MTLTFDLLTSTGRRPNLAKYQISPMHAFLTVDRNISGLSRVCEMFQNGVSSFFKTRHVFVKHGFPGWQQSQNMAKISKSYILTPPHPKGHVMSVKCEEPIDELTVQVWLKYHHSNFKYCTLFVSGTELQTDRRTDKWTERQTEGRSDY